MDAQELDKLISTVEQAVVQLKGNSEAADKITPFEELFRPFAENGKKLLADSKILKIGVVGQVKAGKSSFLNSVMFNGDAILPKASTPMTAGLTVLEYADKPEEQQFLVSYYTKKEWGVFEKANKNYEKIEAEVKTELQGSPTLIDKAIKDRTSENVRAAHELISTCNPMAFSKIQPDGASKNDSVRFADVKELQSILEKYVGAKGDFTPVVKSLTIRLHDERLKDVRIVDTPGVNDPVVSREERTKEFLGECHGVFFLSSSSKFLDEQDIAFMNQRVAAQGIGRILLLASKYDSMLQDLGFQYSNTTHKGDLDYADKEAWRTVNKRFDESKCHIKSNSEKIKCDTTSGIGFSIAHKDKMALDADEKKVLEQMQKFYPDAFGENDYKETFDMLSNISTIRDEYLEKDFKAKKAEIISDKVNAFFANNVEELRKSAEELQDDLKSRLEKIKTTNVDGIRQQKAEMERVFNNASGDLSLEIELFQNSITKEVNDLFKDTKLPLADDLVQLADTEFELMCKRALFGHKTVTRTAKYLDISATKENFKSKVETYVEAWKNGWENNFVNKKKVLEETSKKIVNEFALSSKNQKLEDDVRRILKRVLSDIDINQTLGLRESRDKVVSDAITYIEAMPNKEGYNKEDFREKYKNDSDEGNTLQNKLETDALQNMSTFKDGLYGFIQNLPKEIETIAQKNKDDANAKLNAIKEDIVSKLKAESNQYFQKFEEDIKNAEKVIPEYEKAIAQVETIINALK